MSRPRRFSWIAGFLVVLGLLASSGSRAGAEGEVLSVWSWGENGFQQLGREGFEDTIASLEGAVAVSAGLHHSLALKSDGGLYAWGANYNRQVADTAEAAIGTPRRVATGNGTPLEGVTALAAGGMHSAAVARGEVWSWGLNIYGELGTLDSVETGVPQQAVFPDGRPVTDVVAVAAGGYHTIALTSDGRVLGWGSNLIGELGTGWTSNGNRGALQAAITGVRMIAAGHDHSLAVTSDGSLWAWGGNYSGQVGNGSTSPWVPTPSRVMTRYGTPLTGVVAIASQSETSYAVDVHGLVWSWGRNDLQALGRNSAEAFERLADAVLMPAAVKVAAGQRFGLALAADGRLFGWGDASWGKLGPVPPLPVLPMPTEMTHVPPRIVSIEGGGFHALALLSLARLTPNPAWLNFGTVPVGSSKTLPIELRNTGNEPLALGTVQVGPGSASAQYSVTTWPCGPGSTLDPGDACTASVTFAPELASRTTVPLSISTDRTGPYFHRPLTVWLNGVGVAGDTTPPEIRGIVPSQPVLDPPNHRLVPISIAADAVDASGPVTCAIASVTSSEPDDGLGDGDTADDIQNISGLSVQLRAERAGTGSGRAYAIAVACRDAAGNTSSKTTAVSVPKSRGK